MPIRELLVGKDDFNYRFSFPTPAEARDIYEKGFIRDKQPSKDYWGRSEVHYLGFGTCTIQDDGLEIEFFFYDLHFFDRVDVSILFRKRYRLRVKELPLLHAMIANDIVSVLKGEGRLPRHPGSPRSGR